MAERPPEPVGPDEFGPPITDEQVRLVAELGGMTYEQAAEAVSKARGKLAADYNRQRLQEWRDAYGPVDDDDEEAEDQE